MPLTKILPLFVKSGAKTSTFEQGQKRKFLMGAGVKPSQSLILVYETRRAPLLPLPKLNIFRYNQGVNGFVVVFKNREQA
jgi:hypothetical protein